MAKASKDCIRSGIGIPLLCLFLAVAPVLAQQAPVQSAAGAERSGYTIGSGDVLNIIVLDELALSGLFTVSSQGTISYPFLGNIQVGGMTVEEFNRFLTSRLGRDYLVNPVVTVSIQSYASKRVFVQGEVVKPGVYFLKDQSGVLNILLEAGGTTENASEEIVILRSKEDSVADSEEDFEQIRINLRQLLSGNQSQNIQVQPDDIVYVANASGGQFKTEGRSVNIMGEVEKPGNYPYRLGYTLLNAILEAGGFTEFAAKNRVRVIKKIGSSQKVIVANLDDLINKGKLEEDVVLDPGDLVIVPQSLF